MNSLAATRDEIMSRFGDSIRRHAERNGIPPRLLASMIAVESGGNPAAVSEAGAAGLMQIMPDTATDLGLSDRFDPEQSIAAGSQYLAQLYGRTGDWRTAVAAYHGGIGNIERAGGIPAGFARTSRYTEDVMGLAGESSPTDGYRRLTGREAEAARQRVGMTPEPKGDFTRVTDPKRLATYQAIAFASPSSAFARMPDDPQAVMDFASQQESNFLKRYIVGGGQQLVYGMAQMIPESMVVLGSLADWSADQFAGRDVSFDGLAKAGTSFAGWLEDHVAVENPNFYHNLMSGIGSMIGFMGPGLVTARGTGVLLAKTTLGKTAMKRVADAIGLGVMSTLESAVELGGSIQQKVRDEGMSYPDALEAAQETFWWNLPVLIATNAPYFHPASRAARALIEFPVEGGQERFQEVVQSVVAGDGKWSDFLDWHKHQEATIIGALVGGAAAAVLPGDAKPAKPKVTLDQMASEAAAAPAGPEAVPPAGSPVEPDARRSLLETHAAQDAATRAATTERIGPQIDAEARFLRLQDAVSAMLGTQVDLAARLSPEEMAEVRRDLDAVFAQPSEAAQRHAASRMVQKTRGFLLRTGRSEIDQAAAGRQAEKDRYRAEREAERQRVAALREQRAAAAQVAAQAAPAPTNRAERRAAGQKSTTTARAKPSKKPPAAPVEALEAARASLEAERGEPVSLASADENALQRAATAAVDAVNEADPITQARKFDAAVEMVAAAVDATPEVAPATQEVAPVAVAAAEPAATMQSATAPVVEDAGTVAVRRERVHSDSMTTGFKKSTINTRDTQGGDLEISGYEKNGIIVHKDGSKYTLTHAASGKGFGLKYDTADQARTAATRLGNEFDFTGDEASVMAKAGEILPYVQAIYDDPNAAFPVIEKPVAPSLTLDQLPQPKASGKTVEDAIGIINRDFAKEGLTARVMTKKVRPKAVDALAKAFGVEVVYFELTDKDGNTSDRVSGFTNIQDRDRILLNVHSSNPLLSVAAHEIGHNIQKTDPEAWEKIVGIINSSKTLKRGDLKKAYSHYGVVKASQEEIFDEFTADTFARAIQSEAFLVELRSRDETLFKKLVSEIKSVLKQVRDLIMQNTVPVDQYIKNFAAVEKAIAKIAADVAVARTDQLKAGITQQVAPTTESDGQQYHIPVQSADEPDEMFEMRQRQFEAQRKRPVGWREATAGFYHRARTNLIDENHPVYVLVKRYLNSIGSTADGFEWTKRPDKILQAARSWSAVADVMLNKGVYEYRRDGQEPKLMADGLAAIFKKYKLAPWVEDGYFGHYWQAADHMARYEELGDAYFPDPEVDEQGYQDAKDEFEKYRTIYNTYSRLHPEWKQAVNNLTAMSNAMLTRVMQAGIITQEELSDIITKYSVYAPMYVLENATREPMSYGSRQTPREGNAVYGRDIYKTGAVRLDPIEGLIKNVYRLEHLIAMHEPKIATIEFAKHVTENGGNGQEVAREIPPKRAPVFMPSDSLLRSMGIRVEKHENYRYNYRKALAAVQEEMGVTKDDKEGMREVRRIARDQAAADTMPQFLEDLKAMGFEDKQDKGIKAMRSLWLAASQQDPGVVAVRIDGDLRYYELHPTMWEIFSGASRKLPDIMRFFSAQTALLRGGSVLTPDFMGRNIIRDFLNAGVIAHGLVNTPADAVALPFRVMRGLSESFGQGDLWREWVLGRGATAELVATDVQNHRKKSEDFVRGTGKEYLAYAAKHPATFVFHSHPLRALQYLSQRFEQATRLAVYEKTRDKYIRDGLSLEEAKFRAIIESREASIDFNVAGRQGRILNMMIPFFNAGVQGQDKLIRTMFRDPGKGTAWLRAVGMITIPSMLLYAENYDKEWYQDLPPWMKNLFWCFSPDGGKTVVKIPKPFEIGLIFGSLPERLADYFFKVDPTAMRRWADDWKDTVMAFNPLELLGPMAFTASEIVSNHDSFRDSPIVPQSMRLLEDRAQFTRNTSEFAKWLGEKAPGGGASPLEIDHFVRGSFGGMGKYVMDGASAIVLGLSPDRRDRRAPAPKVFGFIPSSTPVIRAFVQDMPVTYSAPKERFYELYKRSMEANNTYQEYVKTGADPALIAGLLRRRGVLIGMYPGMARIASKMADAHQTIRAIHYAPSEILTGEQKDQQIQQVYEQTNRMMALTIRQYEDVIRGSGDTQKQINAAADLLEKGGSR